MEHVAYAMLLSEWIIFRLDITGWWINMTFRTPGSKVIHHITRLVTFATYPMLWIRRTSKRKKRYSTFMMGKEFSEFHVEPVSGGTLESGQAIWERVWKLQLERKWFYPTRDVQLGLGLIWGCFIYGHMVQVFAFRKGRGLQKVRVSTWILTSAYGPEVWCNFWRKIIKHWILLENYSFLFFYFISCLCICPFLLSE